MRMTFSNLAQTASSISRLGGRSWSSDTLKSTISPPPRPTTTMAMSE